MKTKIPIMYACFIVYWIESERGWGQKQIGHSLHLTEQHANDYVKNYDAEWNNKKEVPDYYIKGGNPHIHHCDKETYTKLKKYKDLVYF